MSSSVRYIAMFALLLASQTGWAQTEGKTGKEDPDDLGVPFAPKMTSPVFIDEGGERMKYVEMDKLYKYPPLTFANEKERQQYTRLVRNIKKVLPIAVSVRGIITETVEVLNTIPTKKERRKHMAQVEAEIKKEYTPKMKKLSLTQGKLLIKLVDRECNSSSYQLVKAFLGPVKAGFYQAFAWTFGASLTKHYDPEGEDAEVERIVLLVKAGQL